jgi:diguanylate cyclase (GGDEF)-like protein/PAS domain S-box-containing protein
MPSSYPTDGSESHPRRAVLSAGGEPDSLFQAVFDNVSVGIALVDPQGYIVSANTADARFLGYTPEELQGKHFHTITHPEDIEVDSALFQSLVRGERDYYVIDKRYLRKDGSIVWGRLTLSLIRSPIGEIDYVVVVCEDIDNTKRAEQALSESQAQMRSMLLAMTDVVVVAHRSGQFRRIHTQSDFYYSANYDPAQEADGGLQSLWQVFPPAIAQQFMDCIAAVLTTDTPQRLEYALEINHDTVWFDASISKLDANQVVWVARDISELKRIQASLELNQIELQRREETYRLLFADNPQPLWVYDLETLAFLEVNDAATCKYGYSRDEFLAMTIADIRPAEDVPALLDNVTNVVDGLDEAGIWCHQTKDGKLIDVEIISHTLTFEGRPAELVLANDVTARRRAETELFRHTLQDALTQLPNRNLLTQRLQALVNEDRRRQPLGYAVLFLDLDRFKIINDSLGHIVGDQVLVTVAQMLRSLVRSEDLVARWGGDEFVLVLRDSNPLRAAIDLAQRLIDTFQAPLPLADRDIFLGSSIGIVIGSPSYTDPAALLRDADIAMYEAKSRGRNRYAIFDDAMHREALQRLELEHALRLAVPQAELVVHYQPIFSLADSQLISLEALVRWQHPEKGLIGPEQFIPLAEETGLITEIDLWVLNAVCQQIQEWRCLADGIPPFRVAVNLSVRDLWNPKLIEDIEQALTTNGLEGDVLTLEVTESMLVEDLETTIQLLTWFRQRGIHISIDDFGTGYSSFSYLHRLPVETLKIDRSFVNRIQESDRNLRIVETIINLGQHLNLKIVAEGIETKTQCTILSDLGCEYGQGFWFSRPLSVGHAAAFLQLP